MAIPDESSPWRNRLACARLMLMRITLALALITVPGHVCSFNPVEPTRTEIAVFRAASPKRTVSFKGVVKVPYSTFAIDSYTGSGYRYRLLQLSRIVKVRHETITDRAPSFPSLEKSLRAVYSPETSEDVHLT